MRRLSLQGSAPSSLRSLPGRAGPAVLVWALLLAATTPLLCGPAEAAPGAAAQDGVLEGVVVNAGTGRPQAGVRLTLRAGDSSGATKETTRSAVTGPRGVYRFEGLPTGAEHIYAVDARHEGGLFAGSAITIPSKVARPPVIESRLKVWDTTTDPGAITVVRDALFLVADDDGVGVIESVVVANASDEAYIGRGPSMGTASEPATPGRPSLGYSLPAATDKASLAIVESDLDLPRLLDSGFGFSITSAIPPGETRTTFSYRVTGAGGIYDLSKTALYPTKRTFVYASEPLTVTGNRLAAGEGETIAGRAYRLWITPESLEAGDTVQIGATAEADLLPGFAWAAVAVAMATALGLAILLLRSRRAGAGTVAAAAEPQRSDVINAIAELDVRRSNGDISEREWRAGRADLKARLTFEPERSP